MQQVLIIGSTSKPFNDQYLMEVNLVGEYFAKEGYDLLYSNPSDFMNGVIQNFHQNNRNVTMITHEDNWIYPFSRSLNLSGCICMQEKPSVVVFMPDGVHSLALFFRMLEKKTNHEIDMPLILYNSNHFFDPILTMIEQVHSKGFEENEIHQLYHLVKNIQELDDYLISVNHKKILEKK